MKKAKKIIGILIILFVLFYTEYRGFSRGYQDLLFTSKDKTDRVGGYTFKFGGNVDDVESWERYRIGYPSGAVTIDHNEKAKITQGRIETGAIIVNLIFGLIAFVLSIVILKVMRAFKTLVDNSRIFDRGKS